MFEVTKHSRRLKKPPSAVRLEIDKVLSGLHSGEHRSLLRGRGLEFKGLTTFDYAAGGNQRIDWLASLRIFGEEPGQFVVRDYHPERKINVVVLKDDSQSMHHPPVKNMHAEILMWLFALSAFKVGDQFRLFMWADRELHDSDWVYSEDDLTTINFVPIPLKKNIFTYMSALEMVDTLFVVISDFGDEWLSWTRELRRLDALSRNIKVLLFAMDEWSDFCQHKMLITIRDPEHGGDRVFDLRAGKDVERAREFQNMRFKKIETIARPLGGFFIPISILGDPIREMLQGVLRTGFDE